MMMWTMRRAGVRLPEAMTSTFMTFVATVIFFAVAGPLAILLGAGRSLAQHGVVLGITLYDLFKTSFLIFVLIGIVMAFAMFFPRVLRDFVHWVATRLEARSAGVAARIERLREGIDRAHECMVAFGSPKGLLALVWAIILSAPSHANKLLAGYVAMRALGLPAHFVDILLVQTFISFLLYFAPTPGASGLAEVLVRRGDVHLRPAGAVAQLHGALAFHQQLRHRGVRFAVVLALAAAWIGEVVKLGGRSLVTHVGLPGYAPGRNFWDLRPAPLENSVHVHARARRQAVHHPLGGGGLGERPVVRDRADGAGPAAQARGAAGATGRSGGDPQGDAPKRK